MSTGIASPIMHSSRHRTSVEVSRKLRSEPRRQQEPMTTSFSTYPPPGMTQDGYILPSGSQEIFPGVSSYWSSTTEAFYPSSDSAYMPTFSVSPTDIWDPVTTGCDYELASASSGSSSKNSFTPPMSTVDMQPAEMYSTAWDQCHLPGRMMSGPLTPPTDLDMFNDVTLFESNTDEHMTVSFPEPATECEYLGVSKLQYFNGPVRHTQPRPIRSASERSPVSPVSGSPYSRLPKDDHMERVKHNPRSDPRYEEKADKDGYYHCPYASEGCNHKPTKQKCIYAKNLDSHLKPYTCRYGATEEACRTLRFSSNACLFRHEREMHGLHNHGMNPYLCHFPGCERARPDNGFPRRWNQRDHMKRVHGHEEVDSDEGADRGFTDSSTRRKKSSSSTHHVPMKKTGSSRSQNNHHAGVPRTTSGSRHVVQSTRGLQTRNIMMQGINPEEVNYVPPQIMRQLHGTYMQPVY